MLGGCCKRKLLVPSVRVGQLLTRPPSGVQFYRAIVLLLRCLQPALCMPVAVAVLVAQTVCGCLWVYQAHQQLVPVPLTPLYALSVLVPLTLLYAFANLTTCLQLNWIFCSS